MFFGGWKFVLLGQGMLLAWERREMHTVFWLENLRETDHLEDLGVDGNIILEWLLGKMGWEGVDCTRLAQDRDQWQAVVNTVMNLWVP
jgi:hypothetical protein